MQYIVVDSIRKRFETQAAQSPKPIRRPLIDEKYELEIYIAYNRLALHIYAMYTLARRKDRDSELTKQLSGLFVRVPVKIPDQETGILVKCAKLELKKFSQLSEEQKKFIAKVLNEYVGQSDDPIHKLAQRSLEDILAVLVAIMFDIEEQNVTHVKTTVPELTSKTPAKSKVEFRKIVERVHSIKLLMEMNGGVDKGRLHELVSAEFPFNKLSPGLVAYVIDNY